MQPRVRRLFTERTALFCERLDRSALSCVRVPSPFLQIFLRESDFFFVYQAGAQIEDPVLRTYNGQDVEVWSRVIWSPGWAPTFSDIKRKMTGRWKISQPSTLVLDGEDIEIHDLSLDGALIIHAVQGAKVLAL